jgi:hypothetical protein
MRKIIFLVSAIFVLQSAAAPSNHDEFITRSLVLTVPDDIEKFKSEHFDATRYRTSRISSGFPATNEQFPFVGDVTVGWSASPTTFCTCGLLAVNWVITSRGCIVNDNAGQLGSSFLFEFGSSSRAGVRTAVFGDWAVWKDGMANVHPDFAIFRLSVAVTLSTTINVIQLPTRVQIDEWFQMASVTIGEGLFWVINFIY